VSDRQVVGIGTQNRVSRRCRQVFETLSHSHPFKFTSSVPSLTTIVSPVPIQTINCSVPKSFILVSPIFVGPSSVIVTRRSRSSVAFVDLSRRVHSSSLVVGSHRQCQSSISPNVISVVTMEDTCRRAELPLVHVVGAVSNRHGHIFSSKKNYWSDHDRASPDLKGNGPGRRRQKGIQRGSIGAPFSTWKGEIVRYWLRLSWCLVKKPNPVAVSECGIMHNSGSITYQPRRKGEVMTGRNWIHDRKGISCGVESKGVTIYIKIPNGVEIGESLR
jgi:hypothetical protein